MPQQRKRRLELDSRCRHDTLFYVQYSYFWGMSCTYYKIVKSNAFPDTQIYQYLFSFLNFTKCYFRRLFRSQIETAVLLYFSFYNRVPRNILLYDPKNDNICKEEHHIYIGNSN